MMMHRFFSLVISMTVIHLLINNEHNHDPPSRSFYDHVHQMHTEYSALRSVVVANYEETVRE